MKLLGLLQAGRGYNVNALAQACKVTRRTIFRDLDILRQSGIPLKFEELEQCYRVPRTYYLPPTNLTPEEALALIVLCHELGGSPKYPFFAPARSAALKLESSLPRGLRQKLQSVAGAVQIRPAPANPLDDHQPVYDQLLQAIAGRHCVRIHYQSLTEWEQICTRLSPYRLLFSQRSWYVIGRSSLHRMVRTFNLGRIRRIEPLEEGFSVPRGFSIDRYLRNAWHLIPEGTTDYEVVVRFSRMVAQNVAEVVWHKTQQVERNNDGTIDFRVKVSGLSEISWWILGYGDQAEVLKPAKLRRIVAERAARMVEQYR